MKTLIAAMLLMSGSAMAQSYYSSSHDDYEVEFLGWCDSNNVMARDSQENIYARENCTDKGLTCRTYHTFRTGRTLVTASCVDLKN